MTILLLGADGQLGWHLRTELASLGPLRAVTRQGRGDDLACDLSLPGEVTALLQAHRPSLIVNAAAYTAVDAAETDEATATQVNGELPGLLGRLAAGWGGRVIHYSTDYVFDGQSRRPYRESDPVAPLNAYGRSKLAGEQALASSGADHVILRTAWVYSLRGRNFLTTMLRLAGERDHLRVVDDQFGCPTSASFIARATRRVAENEMHGKADASGVYHLVCGNQTTWHGFASAIMEGAARRNLLTAMPRVERVATSVYPTPARRPPYSVLDSHRFTSTFDFQMPDWRDELDRVLDAAER
ncbi:MAG: dTDP-4-dehydrorhamnose reductase [Luteibacter sp.]|uniref:dTDP-4-dehydrorhamnose reductase n=1 Tax=Luteibacter sp. TaxID=1886636 RepID=UPI001380A2A9|nr:dTDP-4-dehydrorhamnose reductase [Luteibacter sp.]KAF1007991.1 MAG: dTDP-4-dehydrorhamnose reductase [Luteibacter sp.]